MACGSSSQYEDLIKIVTYKLKNRQIVREEIILAIEEVEQSIKNYCAIPQVPKALKFVWSNMTVELLDYEYERTKESLADTGEIDISTVAEISVGDTSVKMKKGSEMLSKSHKSKLDVIVMNHKHQLNMFRSPF